MRISLHWIQQFVDVPEKLSARDLAELLTLRTCEVEGWIDESEKFKNMVIGEIKKIRPHPNADKLRLCDTDIGDTIVQIVCGGSNICEGILVPVALPGALVDWHGKGEFVELKETEIRGSNSYGMICAGEEIGLPRCEAGEIADISFLRKETSKLAVKPGTPLAHALRLDDVIFEIDNKSITHRPDLWGHYGMARECAVFLGKKLKPYESVTGIEQVSFPKKGAHVNVHVQTEKISPKFCSVIVGGIKIEESPEWLKVQLAACGVRPVNNVVDVTNFVMLELGQPMHAFDRSEVKTDLLEVRYAKDGEILETLDHKKRSLTKEDAVISNGKELLALAGIMGGLHSEISKHTTEIILEAANWNPIMIRKTSQRLGLRSEASQRYEKGLDPALSELAIKRACGLLLQLNPMAKTAGAMTTASVGSGFKKSIQVKLSPTRVNSKIGVSIPEKDIANYLSALGFSVKKSGKMLTVDVPSYRATKDISIEDDLIEEVARMYGYEKIPALLPDLTIKLPHENRERKLKHLARNIVSFALGFTEMNHYSFYKKTDFEKCLLPEAKHFRILNPLSEDQTHLRLSLLPNLLKSIAVNERECPDMKVYEIGRQYRKKDGSYFPLEEKFLCGAVVRSIAKEKEIFYFAKGVAEAFLRLFPVETFFFEESSKSPPYAHPQKTVDLLVRVNDKRVRLGVIFELHPVVKRNFDIRSEVALFEINFSLLANLPPYERSYRPIPKFPGIDIDVSILTDRQTRSLDIEGLIRKADDQLIQEVCLIDIFEGKMLGEDKKSLTYRIRLGALDRTLTDEEMHKVQQKIFENLEKEGYQIRK